MATLWRYIVNESLRNYRFEGDFDPREDPGVDAGLGSTFARTDTGESFVKTGTSATAGWTVPATPSGGTSGPVDWSAILNKPSMPTMAQHTALAATVSTKADATALAAAVAPLALSADVAAALAAKADAAATATALAAKADATALAPLATTAALTAGLATKADAAALAGYVPTTARGTASGVAPLGADSKVPAANLPATMTPSAHAASHGSGAADPITIAQAQVTGLTTLLATFATKATTLAGYGIADAAPLAHVGDASHLTAAEQAALAGTSGTAPSAANKFVDAADPSRTNARTPTAHAASHATGGTDALTPAAIGAAATSHAHTAPADLAAVIAARRVTAAVALVASVTLALADVLFAGLAAGTYNVRGRIYANVTGGTVGLKPLISGGGTGVGLYFGTTTGAAVTAPSATLAAPGTASATAFITAVFSGWIEIDFTVTVAAGGAIGISLVTGASAAGSVLAGSYVTVEKMLN